MSVRFVKFALVGASGTMVNLGVFLSFVRLFGSAGWQTSALAAFIANVTNYVFNNAWTFADRGHGSWSLVRGYVSYLGLSLVGLSASTVTFVGLTRVHDSYAHPIRPSKESYVLILAFQLGAIVVGTVFNYKLSSRFTWREKDVTESEVSDRDGCSSDEFASVEEVITGQVRASRTSDEREWL